LKIIDLEIENKDLKEKYEKMAEEYTAVAEKGANYE